MIEIIGNGLSVLAVLVIGILLIKVIPVLSAYSEIPEEDIYWRIPTFDELSSFRDRYANSSVPGQSLSELLDVDEGVLVWCDDIHLLLDVVSFNLDSGKIGNGVGLMAPVFPVRKVTPLARLRPVPVETGYPGWGQYSLKQREAQKRRQRLPAPLRKYCPYRVGYQGSILRS